MNVPSFRCVTHGSFRDDDIVFLSQAGDRDGWVTRKCVVLDLLVERVLAVCVECAGDRPLDVIREAGQNLRMIGLSEAVHVTFDCFLVLRHCSPPLRNDSIGLDLPSVSVH